MQAPLLINQNGEFDQKGDFSALRCYFMPVAENLGRLNPAQGIRRPETKLSYEASRLVFPFVIEVSLCE